ncbi:MAG TPA: glutathione S-transferase family protein [Micropepsaceae bacterium]|nr:glutathione S-transferase family protein [Micropepsaceae bacterium]
MACILYGMKRSGSCAAECALAEAGAEYETINVDLRSNAQLGAEYAAINPARKIPALRLPEGEIVTESAAILLTIADQYPDAGLLPPAGSDARAQCFRWIAFCASEIYPLVEIADYPERFSPPGEQADALRKRASERLRDRALIIERAIAGNPWLLEGGFSAADLYAANLTRWSTGAEWRAENCPKLERLVEAIASRPKAGAVWRRHFD